MVTGSVTSQAKPIFLMVFPCKFFNPSSATIVPAIPELNTWVVLTGSPKTDEALMVLAAII